MNRRLIFNLVLILLLTASVQGQNTDKISIDDMDKWEFEMIEGTITLGTASNSELIEKGDTFSMTILSQPSSSGTFEYEIKGPDGKMTKDGDLGNLGEDFVYTDWNYWEEHGEENMMDQYNMESYGFETYQSDDTFQVVWNSFIGWYNFTYYKETGVIKEYLFLIDGKIDYGYKNITGSEAELPGFELRYIIPFLLALPVIRKFRVKS